MKGLDTKPAPDSRQRRLGCSHFVSLLAGLAVLGWINGCGFRGTEPIQATLALCSPYGTANIYTVDANNTKAQCLVVKGERFLRTSAYGESVETPRRSRKPTRAPC